MSDQQKEKTMTTPADLAARAATVAETSYIHSPLEYGRVIDDPRHLAGQVVTCTLCEAILMDVDDDDTFDMHARAITRHLPDCPKMLEILGPKLPKVEPAFTLSQVEDALNTAARAIVEDAIYSSHGVDVNPDFVPDEEIHLSDDVNNAISDVIEGALMVLKEPKPNYTDFCAWLEDLPLDLYSIRDAYKRFPTASVSTVTAWWRYHSDPSIPRPFGIDFGTD